MRPVQDCDASCQKLARGSVPSNTRQHTTRRLSPGTCQARRNWPQAGARSSSPQAAVLTTMGTPDESIRISRYDSAASSSQSNDGSLAAFKNDE